MDWLVILVAMVTLVKGQMLQQTVTNIQFRWPNRQLMEPHSSGQMAPGFSGPSGVGPFAMRQGSSFENRNIPGMTSSRRIHSNMPQSGFSGQSMSLGENRHNQGFPGIQRLGESRSIQMAEVSARTPHVTQLQAGRPFQTGIGSRLSLRDQLLLQQLRGGMQERSRMMQQRPENDGFGANDNRSNQATRTPFGQSANISSGNNHGEHMTILARNMKVVDPGMLQRTSGRGGQFMVHSGGNRSEPLGVVSVDELLSLADFLSRVRVDGAASASNQGTTKIPAESKNTNFATSRPLTTLPVAIVNDASVPNVSEAATGAAQTSASVPSVSAAQATVREVLIVPAVQTVGAGIPSIATLFAAPNTQPTTVLGPQYPVQDPMLSAAMDPFGIGSIGPPGLLDQLSSFGLISASNRLFDDNSGFYLLPLEEQRSIIKNLTSDPLFKAELMKKAASSTNPIEYHHLTNLLQNGVIETGNPLQTRNLRDLLESTHQSVLEEKSENAKKALQTQTERRLLNVLRQIQ